METAAAFGSPAERHQATTALTQSLERLANKVEKLRADLDATTFLESWYRDYSSARDGMLSGDDALTYAPRFADELRRAVDDFEKLFVVRLRPSANAAPRPKLNASLERRVENMRREAQRWYEE
ncbi:MAG: hypothetical protein M5R36_07525 [Deltaproteobacteria bacterium]|nr:hypothetical protein [Deltaproteobacteria bacterium]